uniref:Transcription elongation factor SPT4 putative n=1 Tax=Albugo laibachii Nc14 TaxID=890382 RepID=F0WDC2_9STRA|nr:transcription elongation factor SPT4 putative [Albugo laibachii Nc14]|eukprot:CCA19194.1 transcription elongation factor SPT4 putative [Albugo laibachii Nc14]
MRLDDEDELEDAIIHADIPNTFRELRACLTCSLVKTFTQFYDTGCENCAFLQMADNRQRVAECTTAHYDGMIALMRPKESWVAKWQRLGTT